MITDEDLKRIARDARTYALKRSRSTLFIPKRPRRYANTAQASKEAWRDLSDQPERKARRD